MKKELVRDWMSANAVTISPDNVLPDAEKLMVGKMIRRLPVLDHGHLVGIVTYGDIRNARPSNINSLNLWELTYLVTQLKVSEIMTRHPITVSPDAAIGKAAQVMLNNMISGLPVVDDDVVLVGIVTECDIFRLVVKDWVARESETAELVTK